MASPDDVRNTADELYALAPAEFTAERNAKAAEFKKSGEKATADAIRSFAKPSVAAWAVNTFVRSRPRDAEKLVSLGARLRDAQRDLDRDAMRRLGDERHDLVASVAAAVVEHAEHLGQAISASGGREIEQTLQAAIVDEGAGRALQTARLTRTLLATGLEAVDLTDAVAAPPPDLDRTEELADEADSEPDDSDARSAPKQKQPKRGSADSERSNGARSKNDIALARLKRDAREAVQAVDDARAVVDEIDDRIEELSETEERLAGDLDDLRSRVRVLEDELVDVGRDKRAEERRRRQAANDLDRAERDARRVSERLASY